MTAKTGDRVVVESERAAQPGRAGVIEEVLQADPPRYRVRWDGGGTSIIVPASGAVRVEAKAARPKAGSQRR